MIIYYKKKRKKTLVPSTNASKQNAKQMEREILLSHLNNQSKALELKQRMWQSEMEQKERERIFDTLKKRSELEKLGISQDRLDKYFRLTPIGKIEHNADNDDSSSCSDSTSSSAD